MPALHVIVNGDGAFPDLANKDVTEVQEATITGLSEGMQSGRPSVMFRLDLPDGRVVLYQTSLRLLLTAADALKARYGDPR